MIVHQPHRGEGQGYATFDAPIMNQSQHCYVDDIMLCNRIDLLVSLDWCDRFVFALCDWTIVNAQKYLTNETNIQIQRLPLGGPLRQTTKEAYLLSM